MIKRGDITKGVKVYTGWFMPDGVRELTVVSHHGICVWLKDRNGKATMTQVHNLFLSRKEAVYAIEPQF